MTINQNRPLFNTRVEFWIVLLLTVVTVMAYWSIRSHEFIHFDDNQYITNNYHIQDDFTITSIQSVPGTAVGF